MLKVSQLIGNENKLCREMGGKKLFSGGKSEFIVVMKTFILQSGSLILKPLKYGNKIDNQNKPKGNRAIL
jgi:hypothetical protein